MEYFSEAYPSLFLFILNHFKMNDRIERYMTQCKMCENDPEKYSLYVHGYFLPWLDQQR